MTAVLYSLPASHPCATVERALQLKGLPYRRVELIPVAHKLPQRLRFGASTVPGLVLADGTRLTGSRAILRALEAHAPALLPSVGEHRARVERAEQWGDQVLQPIVRRVVWAALRRHSRAIPSYTEHAKLPLPDPVVRWSAPLLALVAQAVNGGSDANVRADLAHLGGHLDRIDGWIAEGALGAAEPNVADLQIAPSVRLLATVGDLHAHLAGRPALALAHRWFPDYAGAVPAGTLPAGWL